MVADPPVSTRDTSGRRIAYDRAWGALLVLTVFLPVSAEGTRSLWGLLTEASGPPFLWLLVGTIAGVVAVTCGLAGFRTRARHLANFALGAVTTGLPLFFPSIWAAFPAADPTQLPFGTFGGVEGGGGWVVMAGLLAVYAGSGIRIVRPQLVLGQALAALGAFFLLLFAFLPGADGRSFALLLFERLGDIKREWPFAVPVALIAAGAICAAVNLVASRAASALARMSRVLLLLGLFFWLLFPILEGAVFESAMLRSRLPAIWGVLRLAAPLFLALDAAIAYLAITSTRS